MERFSDYSALVEQVLRDMEYPGGELAGLYEPISYAMSAGGKRLRPALVLMAADAFGGKVAEAERAAVGVEMFHNFTLVHDDVMDKSDTRRGRPSVHAKWDANHAILSGDTMLTLATQCVMMVDDSILRRVLDVFNAMAIRVYEGQQLDMDFETRDDVTVTDYLRMISDKTGALLGASAQIGALIGGADDRDAELMYEFGMMLGLAFQIQDDWLDVFGEASTFGKPIGGDINNGKKSYLLLTAMAQGGPDAEALAGAMQMPAGPVRVKTVTRLYEKMGIREACHKAVVEYSAKAMDALRRTGLGDAEREAFKQIVDKLTGRKR